MSVNPFHSRRDNVLESFSLAIHVLLCGTTYANACTFYGDSFFNFALPNFIENILIVLPLAIVILVIIFSIVVKILSSLVSFVLVLIRKA